MRMAIDYKKLLKASRKEVSKTNDELTSFKEESDNPVLYEQISAAAKQFQQLLDELKTALVLMNQLQDELSPVMKSALEGKLISVPKPADSPTPPMPSPARGLGLGSSSSTLEDES